MKKIIVLLIMSMFIVSCGIKNDSTSKDGSKKEQVQKRFGDIEKFVKINITDNETKKLLKILENRKKAQAEIKEMIKSATREDKDKIYEKIVVKRKAIMEQIMSFVEKDKQIEFSMFCGKYNKAIKKRLDELK